MYGIPACCLEWLNSLMENCLRSRQVTMPLKGGQMCWTHHWGCTCVLLNITHSLPANPSDSVILSPDVTMPLMMSFQSCLTHYRDGTFVLLLTSSANPSDWES